MMKYTLLIFLIFVSTIVHAEETSFEYTRRIQTDLNLLGKLSPKLYISKINKYRTDLEKYFEHKKRVCHGEFSTVVLKGIDNSAPEDRSKNKLSKEERKLCFREMKALQMTFINNMFLARKRYLVYLHERRVVELSKAREKAINSLQARFGKNRNFRR